MRTETLKKPLWVAAGLAWAAVVAAAVLAFGAGWGAAPAPDPSLAAPWRGPSEDASPRASADYSVIWKAMGSPADAAPVRAVVRPPVSAVPLAVSFEVVATFCEEQPQFCYAILRDRSRKQSLASTGDVVDGMAVAEVRPDGVLVRQGGREAFIKVVNEDAAALPMSAIWGAIGAVATPPPSPEAVAEPRSPEPGPSPREDLSTTPSGGRAKNLSRPPYSAGTPARGAVPQEPPADGTDPFLVEAGQVQSYIKNLPLLMAQVRMAEHRGADGAVDGLVIEAMHPGAVAARRGLQVGDVVHTVNGGPITGNADILKAAYDVLRTGPPTVVAVIERDGRRQELRYTIRPEPAPEPPSPDAPPDVPPDAPPDTDAPPDADAPQGDQMPPAPVSPPSPAPPGA
jgi:type II secretory pathway component PulC